MRKHFFCHECGQTLEQVAQRRCEVSILRDIETLISTALGNLPWLTCSEQVVGLGDLQRHFPTSVVLCFFNEDNVFSNILRNLMEDSELGQMSQKQRLLTFQLPGTLTKIFQDSFEYSKKSHVSSCC